MMFLRLIRDKSGSVLVEAAIMLTLMIFFVLGSVDFLLAFYEWNAATKAARTESQMGASIISWSPWSAFALDKTHSRKRNRSPPKMSGIMACMSPRVP